MSTGVIKTLNDEKGFGFIKVEGMERDLFFHATALINGLQFMDLRRGDELSFEVAQSDKGPHAINVSKAFRTPKAANDNNPSDSRMAA